MSTNVIDLLEQDEHQKIMDLHACHDNLTCSPNEWAEHENMNMR